MLPKRLSAAFLVLTALSVIIAGCGGRSEADCAGADVLCIGLVTSSGGVDDKSFNQAAWEGVELAEAELGALVKSIKFIETKDAKDYSFNIDLFGEQAYDVIVTVGFDLGDTTLEAARKYPDIDFIGVDQFQGSDTPNFAGLLFPEDQAGFMAGALAGMVTKSNIIAAVLGTDLVPPVVDFKEGFDAGAAYVNPEVTLISTFHPGGLDTAFTDPEWGASTAKQAIDQGADVVFGAGGKTGNGALIEAAGNDGLFCIGVDTDQWETLPEAHPCLISSAMKHINPAVFELIKASHEANFPEGNFDGEVGLAPFHDFESEVSQTIKTRLNEIDARLRDGSISTSLVP